MKNERVMPPQKKIQRSPLSLCHTPHLGPSSPLFLPISSAQQQNSCGSFTVNSQNSLAKLTTAAASCDNGGLITATWTGQLQLTEPIVISAYVELRVAGEGGDATAVADGGGSTRLFVLNEGSTLKLSNVELTNGSGEASSSTSTSTSASSPDTSTADTASTNASSNGASSAGTSSSTPIAGPSSPYGKNPSYGYGYSSFNYGFMGSREKGGGAIFASLHTTVILVNCTLSGNTAGTGGALYARAGSEVSIYSSSFTNNAATNYGGGVYVVGSLLVEDSSFEANTAALWSGGAIGVAPNSYAVISNTDFIGNQASAGGGAVYASGLGTVSYNSTTKNITIEDVATTVILDGCRFTNNSAAGSSGGAVGIYSALLNAANCSFEGNYAKLGGAISVNIGVAVILESSFVSNDADSAGGALYGAVEPALFVTSCRFNGNSVLDKGGAVYTADSAYLELTDVDMQENSAVSAGGAISVEYSDVIVSSSNFNFNSALSIGSTGGAIYLEYSDITVSSSNFHFNTARSTGTAVYIVFSTANLTNCGFIDSAQSSSSTVVMTQSEPVYMSGLQMNFSQSEGVTARSDAISILDSTVDAYNIDFNDWEGDVVVSNVDGSLKMDNANFISCKATLLVSSSPSTTAVVRNPILAPDNYPAATDTGSTDVIMEAATCADAPCGNGVDDVTCVDGSAGESFCSCYVSDVAGTVCMSNGPTTGSLSSSASVGSAVLFSVTDSTGNEGTTTTLTPLDGFFPAATNTYIITALWDDTEQLLWQAATTVDSGSSTGGGLILTTVPSAGVLAGGDSVSVTITASVTNSSVPAANAVTMTTLSLTAVGSDGVSQQQEEPVEVRMWLCNEQFYWDGIECVSCLSLLGEGFDGVDCSNPGATIQTLPLIEGYWRVDDSSVYIRRCPVGSACAGGTDVAEYCSDGYKGPYCAVCSDGYGQSFGGKCHECNSSATAGLYTVVAFFLLICLLGLAATTYYLVRPVRNVDRFPLKEQKKVFKGSAAMTCKTVDKVGAASVVLASLAATFKILLVAMQIITQYVAIANVEFSGAYEKMLNVLALFNFDLTFLLSATCVVQTNLYEGLIVLTCVPVIVLLYLSITYAVAHWRSKPAHSAAAVGFRPSTSVHSNSLYASAYGGPSVKPQGVDVPTTPVVVVLSANTDKMFGITRSGPSLAMFSQIRRKSTTTTTAGDQDDVDDKKKAEGLDDITYSLADGQPLTDGQPLVDGQPSTEGQPSTFIMSFQEIKTIIRKKHIMILVVTLFVLYVTLASVIFQVLAPCDHLDNGTSYIRADYSLECSGSLYHTMFTYAAVMAFIYPIGVPVVFGCILWRYRQRLTVNEKLENGKDARKEDMSVSHVAFLWNGYKPEVYYYELVEFTRRIMLTSILVFILPNSVGQEATACLMAFIFAMIFEALCPMMDNYEKILYRCAAIFVFMTIFLSLVAKIDVSTETNYDQQVYEYTLLVMNVLLIVCFIVMATFQCLWLHSLVRSDPDPVKHTSSQSSKRSLSSSSVLSGDVGIGDSKGGSEHKETQA